MKSVELATAAYSPTQRDRDPSGVLNLVRLRRSGSRSRNSGGVDFIANPIFAASSSLTESPVISLRSQANCTYTQHRQAKRHQGDAAHGWNLRDITRFG